MAHHEHHAAASVKAPKMELSAEDKHFKPPVVAWKDLNAHERKAVTHYAIGKGGASGLLKVAHSGPCCLICALQP